MQYLHQLITENGHKLVRYNEAQAGRTYTSVFEYCLQYGGTYDGHKFYNDYFVEAN